ncbi:MAG: hypothetical protein ACO31I_07455 [Prochlorotrichaceae cyanobacterium]|jgi:hypothetical protein
MTPVSEQTCPVCKVKIMPCIGGDRVLFSVGAPGTRSVLWKKVCQYTQNPGCINQDPTQR